MASRDFSVFNIILPTIRLRPDLVMAHNRARLYNRNRLTGIMIEFSQRGIQSCAEVGVSPRQQLEEAWRIS